MMDTEMRILLLFESM